MQENDLIERLLCVTLHSGRATSDAVAPVSYLGILSQVVFTMKKFQRIVAPGDAFPCWSDRWGIIDKNLATLATDAAGTRK